MLKSPICYWVSAIRSCGLDDGTGTVPLASAYGNLFRDSYYALELPSDMLQSDVCYWGSAIRSDGDGGGLRAIPLRKPL